MGRKLEESIARRGEAGDLEIPHNEKNHGKKSKKDRKKKKQEEESENGDLVVEETLPLDSTADEELKTKKKKKRKSTESELQPCENTEKKKKKEKKEKKERDSNQAEEGEEKALEEGANEAKGVKGVVVTGKDVKDSKYKALDSFPDAGLPAEILDCCKNFSKPSPIQANSWPFLLNGRDLIGIAATGSGKTLAFGVPALMHILQKDDKKTSKKAVPRVLVLSPTRELAQQIADVLCDAGSPCGIKSVCLYGGTKKGPQIYALRSGVDIVIGTPGRMKDLIETGDCRLKDVSFVVLDEADRMLDMGFEPEVRSILKETSSGS